LEHFGQDLLEFNQNSVPFDFNGEYLLWMAYQPNGVREVYTFNFETKKRETILRFTAHQGIVSHFKLGGGKGRPLNIVYVQNTTDVIVYDVVKKNAKLIGSASDSVVALHLITKTAEEQKDLEISGT